MKRSALLNDEPFMDYIHGVMAGSAGEEYVRDRREARKAELEQKQAAGEEVDFSVLDFPDPEDENQQEPTRYEWEEILGWKSAQQ